MKYLFVRPARTLTVLLVMLSSTTALMAQPAVVATAEGQIGELPAFGDRIVGARFESIRGQAGDIIFGELRRQVLIPASTEFNYLTDSIHDDAMPAEVGSIVGTFNSVTELPPSSARSRNAANTDDLIIFAGKRDGTSADTMTIDIETFDGDGMPITSMGIFDIPTFPDPSLNDVGVAVDNQGRVTVAYTELPMAGTRVRAQRFDGLTGLPIGSDFPITDSGRAATDIALLDPAGNRLLVPFSDFGTIRGSIVDTTGLTPVVFPDFPISTTPAIFANLNTKAGSDPQSGIAVVAWENLSSLQGDPVNVRARRFDADGNPVGSDFRVNTTTANAQGQPAVAVGPNGVTAIAWAGDSAVIGDELDVFTQVYGPDGQPIGGEIRVNTTTAEVQDKPAVRFLPEPDAQGNPQFVVAWRDVSTADGNMPNGTGNSYRCFSIEGLEDPTAIFTDGFESGDTSSWSDTQP